MPKVYDDWERLVSAAFRKQELWQLFHDHSRTPSGGSTASGTTGGSPASAASPNIIRSRVSPLISSHAHEVLPSSSTTRSSLATPNHVPEKEKQMKRRTSRLRLDRWILTPSGGSTASGTTGGSPASAASPNIVRSRFSPLISSHAHEVLPSSSTTRSSLATPNHGPEKEKQMKRRTSRLRLDRWILTRWLSKPFHSP